LTEKAVEIDHLRTQIVALDQKVQVTQDIQNELDDKHSLLLNSEKARDDLHAQHREYIRKSEEDAKQNKEFQDRLHQKNEDLQKEIDRLNQVIHEKDNHILGLNGDINTLKRDKADREATIDRQSTTILQLQNEIQRITHELNVRIDVEAQLADARRHIQELEAQKDKLKKDLTIASDYLIEQDEKVHQANKTSLELLQHLKDAEIEIETLKDYIIELKHRIAVYIPVDHDSVDKKLAEYINNYPERNRLKVMFLRESSGIYQFGTRKVYVKVEQGKIMIRVGGGYLSVDEFLDIYTPLEIEKLERKSPLKKMSESVAVQKTLVGRELREESPIRSPSRTSPLRKSPSRRSPRRSPKKA
jgi:DNA repair exonuclease SbcCD ATPase subunit